MLYFSHIDSVFLCPKTEITLLNQNLTMRLSLADWDMRTDRNEIAEHMRLMRKFSRLGYAH